MGMDCYFRPPGWMGDTEINPNTWSDCRPDWESVLTEEDKQDWLMVQLVRDGYFRGFETFIEEATGVYIRNLDVVGETRLKKLSNAMLRYASEPNDDVFDEDRKTLGVLARAFRAYAEAGCLLYVFG